MKKGVLLLLVGIIFACFVCAEVSVQLDSSAFGPNQKLRGSVSFNFTDPLDKGSLFIFEVNGVTYDNTTLEAINSLKGPFLTIPANYEATGPNVKRVTSYFSDKGSKIEAMLDLSENKINHINQFRDITALEFDVIGESDAGSYPKNVRVDIGNDGLVEYTFKGALTGGFELVNDSYLADDDPDSYVAINGANSTTYCEKIKLVPSSKYKIGVFARKTTEDAWKLKGSITTEPRINCDKNNCCEFNVGTTFSESQCEITYDVSDANKDYYICTYVDKGDGAKSYFEIGTDTDPKYVYGYYNGGQVTRDYYIRAYWAKFEERLMSSSHVSGIETNLESFVGKPGCTDSCLVVPINITSDSKGKVSLDNLKLQFETTSGMITVISFMPVEYTPERYANVSVQKLPLTNFEDIFTPNEYGNDYLFSVELGDDLSEIVKFNVSHVPSVVINLKEDYAYVGQPFDFMGYNTKAYETNKTIESYFWDFGDGTNTTGVNVSHTFTKGGTFEVSLLATDEDGLTGEGSLKIMVLGLESTLGDEINSSKIMIEERIKAIEKDTTTLDTAKSLGIYDDLVNGLNQIKNLEIQYNSGNLVNCNNGELDTGETGVDCGGSCSACVNNTLSCTSNDNCTIDQVCTSGICVASLPTGQVVLDDLKVQLDQVMSSLPLGMKVDMIGFDGRVKSASDVPTASVLGVSPVDNFELSVVTAQDNVQVNAESRLVTVYYTGKEDIFVLVKKDVIGTGTVYEVIPSGISVKEVLTQGYTAVSPAVYKFTTNSFMYTLTTMDINKGVEAKTFVLPTNLGGITLDKPEEYEASCGNGICEVKLGEDTESCAEDCTQSIPWIWFSILAVVMIGAALYVNFYHGKYSFEYFFMRKEKAKKEEESLFKNPKDKEVLNDFIKDAKTKNYTEDQIKFLLKKKGWSDKQIEFGMKSEKK